MQPQEQLELRYCYVIGQEFTDIVSKVICWHRETLPSPVEHYRILECDQES